MLAVCPNIGCNQRYQIKPEMIGRIARCKKCNNRFKIKEIVYPQNPSEFKPVDNASVRQERKHKNNNEPAPEKIVPPSITKSPQASSNQGSKKNVYKALSLIAIALFGIFTFLCIGSFHIIRENNKGFSIVRRNSFGFSEVFINADRIKSMSPISAAAGFPIGYEVLQRKGIIKSDEGLTKRIDDKEKREFDQAVRDAQRAIYNMMRNN